jgi:lipopolysaccharide export system protein LptA
MNRLLVIALLLLAVLPAQAQEKQTKEVQVAFDSISVRVIDGRTVSEWLRPILRQEDFRLRARNGYDEGNGFTRFWGDVEIVEKGDTIRAERVRYNRDTKIGEADGNVRLTDGEVTIEAPSGTYYSEEETTVFDAGVVYRDSSATLTADRARYLSEDKRAEFRFNVVLKQEDMTLLADSVLHLRDSEESRAWGRIAAEQYEADDSLRTFILADSLYRHAKRDSIRVGGRARVARIDEAAADTLYLGAGSILLLAGNTVHAADSVTVSAAGHALRADSLRSSQLEGAPRSSRVTGKPRAWVEDTELTADLLLLEEGAVADTIRGSGNVFVATPDSPSGRVNQLTGAALLVTLVDDSLRVLDIRGRSRSVLFMESEDDGSSVGFRGSGDGLRFTFAGGELDRVAFYEGVEGIYYPANLLDQLANLDGFIFAPEDRPDRSRLMALFWFDWLSRTTPCSDAPGGCDSP